MFTTVARIDRSSTLGGIGALRIGEERRPFHRSAYTVLPYVAADAVVSAKVRTTGATDILAWLWWQLTRAIEVREVSYLRGSRKHLFDDRLDIGVRGAVVGDAGAQHEVPAHSGIGQIHPSSTVDPAQDRRVGLVECFRGPACPAEAHRRQRDRGEALETRLVIHSVGQLPRLPDVAGNGLPEGI